MERTPLNDWITLVAAAALAAFTGMIAGAIFAGEAGTFREWVSALSGWIAGIGAVMVGVFTIRPLVRQVQVQEDAAKHALVVLAENTIERVNTARVELYGGSRFSRNSDRFDSQDPEEAARKLHDISAQVQDLKTSAEMAKAALGARFIQDGVEFAKAERENALQSILLIRAVLINIDVFIHIEIHNKNYTAKEIKRKYVEFFCALNNAIEETDRRMHAYTLEVAKLL